MYQLFPSSLLLSVASTLIATQYHDSFATAASIEKENEVREILQRMEADVLSFRDEIERSYSKRCETKTLIDCGESNFNDCSSTFPGQVCLKPDELVVSTCGDGQTCNGECIPCPYVVEVDKSVCYKLMLTSNLLLPSLVI